MRDLERELRALDVDWPATPDLAGRMAQLAPARAPRRRRRRGPAALAVALALVGGTLAVEPARSALLEWLGLKSVRIERRAPRPAPGAGLGLGTAVSAQEAARRAGFRPAAPRALGSPDAVYFSAVPPRGAVTYVYDDGRLFVTELVAGATPLIEKAAAPGTTVEEVRTRDGRGYWIAGDAHGFAYVDANGEPVFEDERLAGPTLVLERGALLIRVEGERSRDRALAVAASVPARR